MGLVESIRDEFKNDFVATYGEIFDVIRDGKTSHQLDGIVENNQLIRLYHDADIQENDILKCRMADNTFIVQQIEPEMIEDECVTQVVIYRKK